MKKFFVLLLSLCLFVFVSACADGQNIDSDKQDDKNEQVEEGTGSDNNEQVEEGTGSDNNENQPVKEKFVIDLDLDNYLTYLEISENVQQAFPALRVNGCLSFALYDNVSFTIKSISTEKTETFYCNAAENGASQMGGSSKVEIIQVSGQVIYWM